MLKLVAVHTLLVIAFSLDVGESNARIYNEAHSPLRERRFSEGDIRLETRIDEVF